MQTQRTKTGRRALALAAAALLALLAALTAGCGPSEEPFDPDGAWAVCWDTGALTQSGETALPKDVILFACGFHADGSLYVPDEMVPMAAQIPDGHTAWLSFTNDLIGTDGEAVEQKSAALLSSLAGDARAADLCASRIVREADREGVSGIELDFENLGQDRDLWERYLTLVRKTADKAGSLGLSVRVVLTPDAPVSELDLPEDPTYVVLCYNLHGTGTEPGPKADPAFLKKLAASFRGVPHVRFALAGGGFDWKETGSEGDRTYEVTSVTQAQAESLAVTCPRRDEKSQARTFTYEDEDGARHTVWYADAETLRAWRRVIRKTAGRQTDIDLWRLGAAS